MTVQDVINRVDELVPNMVPQGEKARWVAQLEQMLPFPRQETSAETLTVPFPWDEMYQHWVEAKLYYIQGETARYNQARAMYETLYSGYRDHCNRTRLPQQRPVQYFF